MGDVPAPNTVIKGNLIGLNAAGTAALPAGSPYGGIYVRVGTGIQIGGPTPAERNVISGHPQSGVVIGYTVGGTAAQGTIEGNYIGTDVTGTLPIPNTTGVFIPNSNCIVRNNVIAANTQYGIFADGGSNHVIQGNFIGTDATATLDLGNGDGGIVVGRQQLDDRRRRARAKATSSPTTARPTAGSSTAATRWRGSGEIGSSTTSTLGIDLYAGFRRASRRTTPATATRGRTACRTIPS